MKKYFITLFLWLSFIATSCHETAGFEEESVIRPTIRQTSELDKWIDAYFTQKYNTEVKYRWDAKTVENIPQVYPPDESKVKPALEAITQLLFDIYSLKTIAGADFVKENTPKQILLFGGKIYYGQLGEKMSDNLKPFQMQFYALDDFAANDLKKVRKLMRMAHNNFIRILTINFPYASEKYKKLNFMNLKIGWTDDGNNAYLPMKFGFFSAEASWKPDEDFAETASVLLSYSRNEIDQFIEIATTPQPITPDTDPTILDQRIEEKIRADKARETLRAKQEFVINYYKETLGIDFYKLQAECTFAMHHFVKKNTISNQP